MILSATLFILAVICYSIKELKSFSKLKWMGDEFGFWGKHSDVRKYSANNAVKFSPPNNWYYRFFKIPYRERFPLSATLLVFLTDGAHLAQWAFKILFCSAFYPLTNWWFAATLWVLWGVCFSLCDKYFTK